MWECLKKTEKQDISWRKSPFVFHLISLMFKKLSWCFMYSFCSFLSELSLNLRWWRKQLSLVVFVISVSHILNEQWHRYILLFAIRHMRRRWHPKPCFVECCKYSGKCQHHGFWGNCILFYYSHTMNYWNGNMLTLT